MTKKEERQHIHDKYGGNCAYCGETLKKSWHVDHMEAFWHNGSVEDCERWGVKKGSDSIENKNPSCPRCNRWKSTFTIEQFREQISLQCDRLRRDSSNYRMALDYGLVEETKKPVIFFFETYKNPQ